MILDVKGDIYLIDVTLKGFLASELPQDIREKIVGEYRYINVDCDWWDFILDEFISHMEEAYGAILEKEEIEFDLCRGGYVKYNGTFYLDVGACKDKVEALKEIDVLIATAAAIADPSEKYLVGRIMEAVASMDLSYRYGIVCINYSDVETDLFEYADPFELLSEILGDERCVSLPDELERELEALIKEEFRNLLNRLRKEFEYLISDAAVIETLDVNGFLFTKDGERIPGFYPITAETDHKLLVEK